MFTPFQRQIYDKCRLHLVEGDRSRRHRQRSEQRFRITRSSTSSTHLRVSIAGTSSTSNMSTTFPNSAAHSKLVQLTAGGWEYSGVTYFWSGSPCLNGYVPGDGCDLDPPAETLEMAASATSARIMSVVRFGLPTATILPAGQNPMWFNPAVFAAPANGSFGNFRRNSIYGPGIANFNMSLFKNFNFTENTRLQLRFEALQRLQPYPVGKHQHQLVSAPTGRYLLWQQCRQLRPDHQCPRPSSAATRRQVLLLTSVSSTKGRTHTDHGSGLFFFLCACSKLIEKIAS